MEPNNNPVPEAPVSETPAPEAPTISVEPIDAHKPAPQPEPKPAKSNKPLIWCLSILAIIGIAAAAVFAYLYFTSPAPTPTPAPSNNQSSTTSDEPTTTEETEITDTLLKKDLDEKIAILHGTNQTDSPLFFRAGTHPEFALYQNGTLSDVAKLSHLAQSLKNYQRELTQNEKEIIAKNYNYEIDEKGNLNVAIDYVIDADKLAEEYYKLYGEKLNHGSLNDEFYCPLFLYDKELNMYFENTGCGGTSSYSSIYYKTKYTSDDNHAYVYISAAAFDAENGNVYCEIVSFDNYKNIEPCSNNDNKDENGYYEFNQYSLEPSSLGKYRFVFNKADDGTYYFSKVEKL